VEIPAGSLNALSDILVEEDSAQYFVLEIPVPTGGGGSNIFIMSE
jgi:hypothetical protein